MPRGLPFYTKNPEYASNVYHDQSDCPEAKKIRLFHRRPGKGGLNYCESCKKCAELHELKVSGGKMSH